ncbi:ribosome maturation factor RimM [Ideonella sp. TBM-1]|uniref:Ribosome maturation factor RimM n=1 Tax=Ideonella livida TaxID=2707176 RepID=A0A7C9TJ36_9BURK|nr:ribosome maturation factor RimM [Ideonella livida]NDY91700.1 ribosome maturation factor RimM [Ideonella livida]
MTLWQQLDEVTVWPDDAVEVGRIVDAWGIKGGFKVQPFSADPKALFSSRRWFLQPPAAPTRAGVVPAPTPGVPAGPRLLKITHAKAHGEVVVAQAQDVPDRSAAEALKGTRVFVARGSFPTPTDGEYYWVDLIGLTVVNRQDEVLGVVADLLDTGPHCVLRIRARADAPEGGADERLVPFVEAYVDRVDLPARRIVVDWGLDY